MTSKFITVTFIVLCSQFVQLLATKCFAQDYYPLMCKTGPNLRYITTFSGRALRPEERNGTSGSLSFTAPVTQIFFSKNMGPANNNGSGLVPGACAWVDRALGPNEPDRIVDLYARLDISIDQGISNIDTYPSYKRLAIPRTRFIIYVRSESGELRPDPLHLPEFFFEP